MPDQKSNSSPDDRSVIRAFLADEKVGSPWRAEISGRIPLKSHKIGEFSIWIRLNHQINRILRRKKGSLRARLGAHMLGVFPSTLYAPCPSGFRRVLRVLFPVSDPCDSPRPCFASRLGLSRIPRLPVIEYQLEENLINAPIDHLVGRRHNSCSRTDCDGRTLRDIRGTYGPAWTGC